MLPASSSSMRLMLWAVSDPLVSAKAVSLNGLGSRWSDTWAIYIQFNEFGYLKMGGILNDICSSKSNGLKLGSKPQFCLFGTSIDMGIGAELPQSATTRAARQR
jgi:hypothetical protein